jgi:hypothetical protein
VAASAKAAVKPHEAKIEMAENIVAWRGENEGESHRRNGALAKMQRKCEERSENESWRNSLSAAGIAEAANSKKAK